MTVPVWDEVRVQRWLSRIDGLEAELAQVSEVLFAAAGLQPGMDVLDVGCGVGSTTRRAADAVAPDGSVTGLDIGPAMIDAARREAGSRPIRWVTADVVTHEFAEAAYDVVLSRFGVMFFSDPPTAFAKLAAATRSGGRLRLAVWRLPGQCPLFDVPYDAVTAALQAHGIAYEEPPTIASSLGDPDRTGALLSGAGWSDVEFAPSDLPLYVEGPGPFAEVLENVLDQGRVRMLLETQPADVVDIAREALRRELTPRYDGTGVPLPGGFMIISATRR